MLPLCSITGAGNTNYFIMALNFVDNHAEFICMPSQKAFETLHVILRGKGKNNCKNDRHNIIIILSIDWQGKWATFEQGWNSNRLQALNLHSLKGRLHRADLIQCWKILNGQSCIQPEDLFEAAPQSTMIRRGHGRKIFGKYQAEVRHLSHAYILLLMGLFEVLIANMMLICGANNIKINIT